MKKIINIKVAINTAEKLHKQDKTIVVAGGCFDILHPGHILFLEKAKQQGDILFVMLESDNTIKLTKGNNRPIHTQKDRALALAALNTVNYIILLTPFKKDSDYDNLLSKIKPTIIATTTGDPKKFHKERQAKLIGINVVEVIKRIEDKSTSNLAKLLLK